MGRAGDMQGQELLLRLLQLPCKRNFRCRCC